MRWRMLSLAVTALLAFSALGVAAQEPGTEPSTAPSNGPGPGEPQPASPPSNGTPPPPPCDVDNASCPPPQQQPPPSNGPSNDPAAKECYQDATTDEQRGECVRAYCESHSDQFCAKWCHEHPDGTANCQNQPPIEPKPVATKPRPACDSDEASSAERCKPAKDDVPKGEEAKDHEALRFIDFVRDDSGLGFSNYTVSGQLVLQKVEWHVAQVPTVKRDGSILVARVGDERIVMHDEPGGLLAFKLENSTATLVFPSDATVTVGAGHARVLLADGRVAMVRYDHASWSADHLSVMISGFGAFHVPPADAKDERGPEDREDHLEVEKAIEDRRLGAQVAVGDEDVPDEVEVLSYDDVQVNVSKPDGKATPSDPLRIRVEADLAEGRTVSVDIAGKLLSARSADQVILHYYDVNDDGTETEVVLVKASDINDVLDPTDDEGQPEYWVVFDGEGAHILVSVPHWSIHVFTVAAVPLPNVMVGLVVGIGITVLAAVGLFMRRR